MGEVSLLGIARAAWAPTFQKSRQNDRLVGAESAQIFDNSRVNYRF